MNQADPLASPGYLISWAARLSARLIDQELKPYGVTAGYLPVLFSLGDGATLSPSALAEAAAIEQPTMTNTLARMERDGLIVRRPHPTDGRSTLVSCTPAAVESWQAIKPRLSDLNAELLSALPAELRAEWLAGLRTIVAKLNERTSPGG